jgi:hypothetical protein
LPGAFGALVELDEGGPVRIGRFGDDVGGEGGAEVEVVGAALGGWLDGDAGDGELLTVEDLEAWGEAGVALEDQFEGER